MSITRKMRTHILGNPCLGTYSIVYVKIATTQKEDGKIKVYSHQDKRTCTIEVNIKILHRQHTSKESNINHNKISKLLI
jgi:hypothetical protein